MSLPLSPLWQMEEDLLDLGWLLHKLRVTGSMPRGLVHEDGSVSLEEVWCSAATEAAYLQAQQDYTWLFTRYQEARARLRETSHRRGEDPYV